MHVAISTAPRSDSHLHNTCTNKALRHCKTVVPWPWLVFYGKHSWLLLYIEHSSSCIETALLVYTRNTASPRYNSNIVITLKTNKCYIIHDIVECVYRDSSMDLASSVSPMAVSASVSVFQVTGCFPSPRIHRIRISRVMLTPFSWC